MGTEIHWLAVVIAAIAGFAVGGIWYGPLFGKAWMAERGVTPESAKQGANMAMIFGTTFVLNLIAAFILDHVYGTYNHPDLATSVMISGGIALGFIVTSIGVNYLFSRLSLKLFLIDAGYWFVIYCVMGAVLDVLS
jgi:hypothetical protein